MQSQGTQFAERATAIIEDRKGLEGPLLPILHDLQEEFGYVPAGALPIVAEALNMSRAEVYGVFSFYHDFRSEPAGRHVLKVCLAESCQAMGSDAIAARFKKELGIDFHETTTDGAVTIEPVYCLGLCHSSPNAMLDDEVYARLDDEGVAEIVAEARK
jgi:formate dehydrogenase subunit gamma